MKLLIKNATTHAKLLGFQEDRKLTVNLSIQDDVIELISASRPHGDFDREIDATGLFLAPGLVDPQVHFREPGQEYKEDIVSGSKAAAQGGFTQVISMPNTSPTADNPNVVAYMKQRSQDVGICKVHPTGALSVGLAGTTLTDFKSLKTAGAVAITDDGKGVQDDQLFEHALINAKEVDLPILDHSEDESLSNGGAIHLGKVSDKYGIKGIDASSEAVHVARGCQLAAKTHAHYHALHVSTKASIDALRQAKAQGFKVTAEVSPHHLLLCDEDIPEKPDATLDANWKMNPPLRSREDMMACRQALVDGVFDAIATDHAPHSPDEKSLPIEQAPFGIIGLETAFPLIYTHFVKTKQITLTQCIDLMSQQAGALFNIECGRLIQGSTADIVLLDLDNSLVVSADFFASKSRNSPFIGDRLYGRPVLTINSGKIVFNTLSGKV